MEKEGSMFGWVKCFRLPICLLAGLLTFASFKIDENHEKVSVWVSLVVFLIACSTMLQNDWRDREHDLAKGKSFVCRNLKEFSAVLVFFWMLVFCCIWISMLQKVTLGIGLAFMALVGLIYSETRKIPLLPTLLVAVTSASPALLPFFAGAGSTKLIWVFFSVVCVIFGREIVKDIDDRKIDNGYKWTIPCAFGIQTTKMIASGSIVLGLIILAKVVSITLFGTLLVFVGVILLYTQTSTRVVRCYIDVGMVVAVLSAITVF